MPEDRMPRFELAQSGVALSRLGLGTAAFGGADWSGGRGAQDDAVSQATIRRALEAGINWIDTDAVFGLGHAEEVIGEVVRTLAPSERPQIATAVGFDWDGRSRRTPPRQSADPRRIRQQIERSRGRLGVDVIDLVKLHFTDPSAARFEDMWSTLLDIRHSGLARAVGLVAPDSVHLERAERIGGCDAVFVELSILDRRVAEGELSCRGPSAPAFIAYRTLAAGRLLKGEETGPLRSALETIAARRHSGPTAVATAWSLAWPGIAGAVVGARCPAHLDTVLDAAALHLTARDFADIANLLATASEARGPVNPRQFAKAA
jgi:aryl-alcohol dehydrogenase-like predicted oxidoreductase